jgi:hypothetical protein
MKSLGRLNTSGNPVCIALQSTLGDWSGLPRSRKSLPDEPGALVTFVNDEGVRYALLGLFTGSCEVLASDDEIALVEIREAPEGYELADGLLEFSGVTVAADILKLGGFGGPIVLFDASRQPEELEGWLEDEAEAEPPRPAVKVEVAPGCWSVSLFEIEQEAFHLSGAWLQKQEPEP